MDDHIALAVENEVWIRGENSQICKKRRAVFWGAPAGGSSSAQQLFMPEKNLLRGVCVSQGLHHLVAISKIMFTLIQNKEEESRSI